MSRQVRGRELKVMAVGDVSVHEVRERLVRPSPDSSEERAAEAWKQVSPRLSSSEGQDDSDEGARWADFLVSRPV